MHEYDNDIIIILLLLLLLTSFFNIYFGEFIKLKCLVLQEFCHYPLKQKKKKSYYFEM